MAFAINEGESLEARNLRVGEVSVISSERVIDRKGHEYIRRDVEVADESDSDPQLRDWYRERGDDYERMLRFNMDMRGTGIKDGIVEVPQENAAARWLYYDENGNDTQMIEWARRFPTAIALEPLQRLDEGGQWLRAGKLDDRSLELFTNMVDGIGLRSRARIYSQQLVEYAQTTNAESLDIVSLGSGAAVPNIEATRRLEADDKAVHWRFYDFDPQALLFAEKLIGEKNFQYSTFDYGPTWVNPDTGKTEPKGQNYLRAFGIEDESVDIVDALGLWEYLKPEHATKFASKLYAKLKPGGSLIVSNMLPSRPQREFNQRAVGWPGLYLRNDTDLLDIISAAGIDTKQVTMTHSGDGVYVVMEVKKP